LNLGFAGVLEVRNLVQNFVGEVLNFADGV